MSLIHPRKPQDRILTGTFLDPFVSSPRFFRPSPLERTDLIQKSYERPRADRLEPFLLYPPLESRFQSGWKERSSSSSSIR